MKIHSRVLAIQQVEETSEEKWAAFGRDAVKALSLVRLTEEELSDDDSHLTCIIKKAMLAGLITSTSAGRTITEG